MSSAFAAESRIGVVIVNRLLEESPQAIAAQKKLRNEFSARDKKLIDQQKDMKSKEDRLKRDASVMSEAERTKLDKEIREIRRELRRSIDELREERTIRTNQELGKLQKVVNQAIKDVGKADGYDVILYEGVAYASKNADLTEKILARLKEMNDSAK
jgi:outer membrane protein